MPLSRDIVEKTVALPYGEQAYRVVERLTDAGYDTWWAGGAVRDMLLNNVPADIDIATAAEPEVVATLFPGADSSAVELGSLCVRSGTSLFEVTTFRQDDSVSDGRRPASVSFGTREQDAKRRDFTINALYFHPISRELYDPFSGEGDLKERLIRFIGEPSVRITHDALRLLRAVRFRALLDGQYHPETYHALRDKALLVKNLSGVRITGEFEKMLLGPHPERALEDLWELGILQHIFPELYVCKGIPQPADYHKEGDVWEHMLLCAKAFREEDDIDIRIATIFHDGGKSQTFSLKGRIRFDHHATVSAKIAEESLARLQLPSKRMQKISWLIAHHMMMGSFADMNEQRKAHWYFHPWFADLLRLFYLDIAGTDPPEFGLYEAILRDYHSFLDAHPRPLKPLLKGEEVMGMLGIEPGERVGEILKRLHEAQLQGKVTSKKEARAFVEKLKGDH